MKAISEPYFHEMAVWKCECTHKLNVKEKQAVEERDSIRVNQ